ncbi:GNAT family N-acetyltransferase [Thiocystis violascens]|uniref:Putative acetyltransferase n=1 Tax=Thiocystis violascens (strain ATCC 17096 / DSM 198 / 6111) TaxID=765911 RepID=I3YCR9_THIV6|nr:GNAT family N-acetyltransferase [Thiocystis violascens]AFL74787.1 putative acetyltransferase [Thiocystis violascens DSM 198]
MKIVAFDPRRHHRAGFACGHDGLDEYLRRYASQSLRNHLARVYVAEDGDARVLGYYTLSAASLGHDEFPEPMARRLPKYPVPAVLIGRMASDRQARESGLRIGSRLLIHALKQAIRAADTIGVQCVIVDSKPEAVAFYRRFGFIPLTEDGLKLYLPIATVKTLDHQHETVEPA